MVKHDGKSNQRGTPTRPPRAAYDKELPRLQAELVTMQEGCARTMPASWCCSRGRDAAGKGSAIKRVTAYLNSRIARIVALPSPTERLG